jgi:hypothetical protein
MENEIYICGMQPLEPDNPMYGIIIAREKLECHDPVEFECYDHPHPNATWFNANLCGYCAGSFGLDVTVDAYLREEWTSLLLVCQTSRSEGATPLARTRKRNESARAKTAQTAHLIGEVRPPQEAG